LRGLGIGIVVTALLMGVAMEDGIPLTDAEIRAKAFALGMVESDSLKLTDVGNVTPPPGSGVSSAAGGSGPEDPVPAGGSASGEGTEADSMSGAGENPGAGLPEDGGMPDSTPEGSSAVEESERRPSGDGEPGGIDRPVPGQTPEAGMITVVIEAGTTSYVISQMLEEAGLVEDAAGFDTYLCGNGYSTKVQEGTYAILAGTSEEEIAKIITKSR